MILLNPQTALDRYWASQDALSISEPEPVKPKTNRQLVIDQLNIGPSTTEELELPTSRKAPAQP